MKARKIILALVLTALIIGLASAASNICDVGCALDSGCSGDTPYLCEMDWWPDKCVPQGYDLGACGSPPAGKGYCSECDEGCVSGGGCSGGTPYLCKISWWPDKCVLQGYDFGCCGGISTTGEKITVLTVTLNNTDPNCTSEYPLTFEVKRRGEGDWIDYSDNCIEGKYSENLLQIGIGESMTLTCRSKGIPHYDTGPHEARISWCTHKWNFTYGEPQTSGKYCVVNVTEDGDNVNEINIDNLILTITARINEIRAGDRGSATLGAYDPIFYGLTGYVPVNDIVPAADCKAKCPDCAVVLNLKEDITGKNVKSAQCPVEAGTMGYANTGAIFLVVAAISGGGIGTTGDDLTPHQQFGNDAGNAEVCEELGNELYKDPDKYLGSNAMANVQSDFADKAAKYGMPEFPEFPTAARKEELSMKMIDEFKKQPGFATLKQGFIDDLVTAGTSQTDAITMVDTFFSEGRVYFPGIDEWDVHRFNNFLATEVKLFDGKTLKEFVEVTSFGKVSSETFAVMSYPGTNVQAGYLEGIISLDGTEYFSDYVNMVSHEIGHHFSDVELGHYPSPTPLPNTVLASEVPAIKANQDTLNALNSKYPDSGYDLVERYMKMEHYATMGEPKGYYIGAMAMLDYFEDKGIDLVNDPKYGDELVKVANWDESLLKVSGKFMGLLGDIADAMKKGGKTLSDKLKFDKTKKKYVWIGKGMKGTKTVTKVIAKGITKGLGVVLLVDDKLGGIWGVYESATNPLSQRRVEIDTFSSPADCGSTCDSDCGSMIVSQIDDEYKIISDFTIKAGYLWDIHIGGQDDKIDSAVAAELGLTGIGMELKPSYMECTPVAGQEYMNCVDKEQGLDFTEVEDIMPTDADTGYIMTEATGP